LSLAKAAAVAAAFDANGPQIGVGGWLAAAQARAAETVVGGFNDTDPGGSAAASAREAIRAWTKGTVQSGQSHIHASTWLVANSWNSSKPAGQPPASEIPPEQVAWTDEGKIQCQYLRDIFGNPFRNAPTLNNAVRDANVIALA